jgi:surface protein
VPAADAPNLSQVTSLSNMFRSATSFNQDLSGRDVSNITDVSWMFSGASAFNQDLSGWDVSSATTMTSMFAEASAFNQDLIGWDAQALQNGVTLNGGESTYCDGEAARQNMIDSDGCTILILRNISSFAKRPIQRSGPDQGKINSTLLTISMKREAK